MAQFDLVTQTATRVLPKPMPNGYSEQPFNHGSVHRMASGRLIRESTVTGLWRRFTIEWAALTSAQRAIVDAAVTDMLDGSTAEFTPLEGAAVTVTLAEDIPEWEMIPLRNGLEYRYAGKLTLEQYD